VVTTSSTADKPVRTAIPARLDRLRWSPFIGGLIEVWFGVNAEGKSLETIAKPLTAVD
jgi:hypothetical protein